MKVRMTCTKGTQRFLRQGDIKGVVHDAEMVVATLGGEPGKGGGHPDNKEAFIGTHGASLNLVACSKAFVCGQDYLIEITDAPAEAPPSPTS